MMFTEACDDVSMCLNYRQKPIWGCNLPINDFYATSLRIFYTIIRSTSLQYCMMKILGESITLKYWWRYNFQPGIALLLVSWLQTDGCWEYQFSSTVQLAAIFSVTWLYIDWLVLPLTPVVSPLRFRSTRLIDDTLVKKRTLLQIFKRFKTKKLSYCYFENLLLFPVSDKTCFYIA